MNKLSPLTWITAVIGIYHLVIVGQLPTWLGLFLPNQIHLAISIICALFLIFSLRRAKKLGRAVTELSHEDHPH